MSTDRFRMHKVDPMPDPAAEPAKWLIIHSGEAKVGDTVRAFEYIDGAYQEIEGGGRIVDG